MGTISLPRNCLIRIGKFLYISTKNMYEGKSDQPSLRPNYKNKECAENGLDFGSKIAGGPRYYFSESPKKKLRMIFHSNIVA